MPFDLKTNRKLFAALNVCVNKLHLEDRGFVSRLYPEPKDLRDGCWIKLTVKGKSVVVTLGVVLARQQGLFSRSTTVLTVAATEGFEEWANKYLVVKISFPSKDRFSEAEFVGPRRVQTTVRKTGDNWVLDHIPSLLHCEDIVFGYNHLTSRLERYLKNCKWVDAREFEYNSRVCRIVVAERLYSVKELESAAQRCQVYFDVVQGA